MASIRSLRREIAKHDFLWIIEDASTTTSLAVVDSRDGNAGTSIDTLESLRFLIEHGADAWLESAFNGIRA